MEDNSILVIYSAPEKIESNDVHYRYRQDTDLYYLTGLTVHPSALILTKDQSCLFVAERDPQRETWEGPYPGPEEGAHLAGIEHFEKYDQTGRKLNEMMTGKSLLYYAYGTDPEKDANLLKTAATILKRARAGQSGPSAIRHASVLVHEVRLFKDEFDLSLMRETAKITDEAHRDIIRSVRPGMYEYELEAILLSRFRKHGATEAYPSIVAAGANACFLHYITNRDLIDDNELILTDAGARKHYIHSDVTRTFPSGGKFTADQRLLYDAVLDAQQSAIAMVRPGITLDEIHEAVCRNLTEFLMDAGILKNGSIDSHMEEQSYKTYYMHRTSHWLGYDVHDAGPYYRGKEAVKLEPGMLFTIEPGLYLRPDAADVPVSMRGTGIRIEDNILVTEDGFENLTANTPVTAEDIENLAMSDGRAAG